MTSKGRRLRIGPVHVPAGYSLPPRPAEEEAEAQDAYRQSMFLLGEELALFRRAMGMQLAMAQAMARSRTPEAAALLLLWSRAFACLDGACRLLLVGRYAACPPLVRAACDLVAAQRGLMESRFQEWWGWLESYPAPEREHAALEVALGRYRSSAAIAQHPRLAAIYRAAQELSQPHLGATVVEAAPEVAADHLPVPFAESRFHLGWSQVMMGWLLELCLIQLDTAVASGLLAEEAVSAQEELRQEVETVLSRPERCQLKEAGGRFLLVNFRRSPGALPRRILL